MDTLESNTNLESCYKKGWLEAEQVPLDENGDESRRVYVFPGSIQNPWEVRASIMSIVAIIGIHNIY